MWIIKYDDDDMCKWVKHLIKICILTELKAVQNMIRIRHFVTKLKKLCFFFQNCSNYSFVFSFHILCFPAFWSYVKNIISTCIIEARLITCAVKLALCQGHIRWRLVNVYWDILLILAAHSLKKQKCNLTSIT